MITSQPVRIAVVGTGNVGSTFAYALLLSGLDDVCLSLPTVVCRSGIEWVLRLNLDEKGVEALRHSARVLKETRGQLAIESLIH